MMRYGLTPDRVRSMRAFDVARLRQRVAENPMVGWRGEHALLAKVASSWLKDKHPLDIAPWVMPYREEGALPGVPPGLRNKPIAVQRRYLARRSMFAHMAGAA